MTAVIPAMPLGRPAMSASTLDSGRRRTPSGGGWVATPILEFMAKCVAFPCSTPADRSARDAESYAAEGRAAVRPGDTCIEVQDICLDTEGDAHRAGPPADERPRQAIPAWVWAVLLTKFLLATSRRSLYPYVPELSRATKSTEQQVAGTIALMQVNYMLCPLLTPLLATKMRFHAVMVLGVALQAATLVALGMAKSFWLFALSVFMLGSGKGFFDPASLTVIRQEIPADSRSRVAALIEFSWGLSSGIGIPATGLLMSVFWQFPFFVYAGLCACTTCFLFLTFRRPATKPALAVEEVTRKAEVSAAPALSGSVTTQASQWSHLLRSRKAWAVLLLSAVECACMDLLMINFGVWLESVHGLSLSEIAKVTFLIGVADISAEVIALMALPRFRKPTTFVIYALAALALSWALVPLLCSQAAGLSLGLIGCFFCFAATEATIVGNLAVSVVVEVPGCGEGFLESGSFAFQGVGRILGTVVGPPLFSSGGLTACGLAGATASGAALLCYIAVFGCSDRDSESNQ